MASGLLPLMSFRYMMAIPALQTGLIQQLNNPQCRNEIDLKRDSWGYLNTLTRSYSPITNV